MNPLYYRLIEEFGTRTGVPVVMNTSFNLRGEAIVHTSTDAHSAATRHLSELCGFPENPVYSVNWRREVCKSLRRGDPKKTETSSAGKLKESSRDGAT